MWSPTKLYFLFYDFFYLLWFFKDSAEINKKEKDKTISKTVYNMASEVRLTILKVERGVLSDFRVLGGKTDIRENWGR